MTTSTSTSTSPGASTGPAGTPAPPAGPGPVEATPRGYHFPVLDTLRAVGALLVLLTHTAFLSGVYLGHGVHGSVFARFDVGVAIFFVLSGFLLSHGWLAAAAHGQPAPTAGRYLWKRLLRIYPVYVVAVVLVILTVQQSERRGVGDWLITFVLGDIYVHDRLPDGLTQMWSLATEAAFYLVLPLLMLAAVGRRRRLSPRRVLLVALAMLGVTVWWLLDLAGRVPDGVHRAPLQWLPSYLSWFAVGITLALAHVRLVTAERPGRWVRALQTLGRQPGACWVAAAALLLLLATPLAGPVALLPPTLGQALTKNLGYALIGALLVVPGVFGEAGSGYTRAMSHPWLRHLGVISYGVFCLHLPIVTLVMRVGGYRPFLGHTWQITLGTLVVSLVAAELAYRLVERPTMRLRDVGLPGSRRAPVRVVE